MGPASAQLLRQLMLNQDTCVDAKAYSTERLTAYAPLTQQSSLS